MTTHKTTASHDAHAAATSNSDFRLALNAALEGMTAHQRLRAYAAFTLYAAAHSRDGIDHDIYRDLHRAAFVLVRDATRSEMMSKLAAFCKKHKLDVDSDLADWITQNWEVLDANTERATSRFTNLLELIIDALSSESLS